MVWRGAGRQAKDVKKRVDAIVPPPPRLEDELPTPVDDEIPMYFTEPKQLLDHFTQLEESNLFLIQNCQETEQQLEELRQSQKEIEREMDRQTRDLKEGIAELQEQIRVEEGRKAALKRRLEKGCVAGARHTRSTRAHRRPRRSTGVGHQARLLSRLSQHVKQVYIDCGFDGGANPSTLTMLAELEVRECISASASLACACACACAGGGGGARTRDLCLHFGATPTPPPPRAG